MTKFYKTKKLFIILSLIIFLTLVSVNFVFSQWTPEVKYPEIGTKTITKTTSLPEYINYIFSLAIIVGVIVAVGVLIYGGFLYLTSAGKPEQLNDAKSRIFNGFLGLVILLGSYLILNTVNPQLTIIRLEPIVLTQGVKLIDRTDGTASTTVGSQVPDIQKEFGEDFQPTEIHILPGSRGKIEAKGYSSPNYQGTSTPWIATEGSATFGVIKSLDIRGISAGVYLSKSQPDGSTKTAIPLLGDAENLQNSLGINDPDKIRVDNRGENDFAAILYEDDNFHGQCRVMFEKKIRPGFTTPTGNIDTGSASTNGTTTSNMCWVEVADSSKFEVGDIVSVEGPPGREPLVLAIEVIDSTNPKNVRLSKDPFLPPGTKITITKIQTEVKAIPGQDQYGTINGPSSVQVINLGPKENCKKVILYQEPYFSGTSTRCEITPNSTPTGTSTPFYIPKKIVDVCGDEWRESFYPPEYSSGRLRSIKIYGKCAVLLFNNTYNNGNWDRNTTERCELFKSTAEYFQDGDLEDNWIGQCNPYGIYRWRWAPCASAIAIYPLK